MIAPAALDLLTSFVFLPWLPIMLRENVTSIYPITKAVDDTSTRQWTCFLGNQ